MPANERLGRSVGLNLPAAPRRRLVEHACVRAPGGRPDPDHDFAGTPIRSHAHDVDPRRRRSTRRRRRQWSEAFTASPTSDVCRVRLVNEVTFLLMRRACRPCPHSRDRVAGAPPAPATYVFEYLPWPRQPGVAAGRRDLDAGRPRRPSVVRRWYQSTNGRRRDGDGTAPPVVRGLWSWTFVATNDVGNRIVERGHRAGVPGSAGRRRGLVCVGRRWRGRRRPAGVRRRLCVAASSTIGVFAADGPDRRAGGLWGVVGQLVWPLDYGALGRPVQQHRDRAGWGRRPCRGRADTRGPRRPCRPREAGAQHQRDDLGDRRSNRAAPRGGQPSVYRDLSVTATPARQRLRAGTEAPLASPRRRAFNREAPQYAIDAAPSGVVHGRRRRSQAVRPGDPAGVVIRCRRAGLDRRRCTCCPGSRRSSASSTCRRRCQRCRCNDLRRGPAAPALVWADGTPSAPR